MKFTIAIESGTKKLSSQTCLGVLAPGTPSRRSFDKAREAIEAHCEVLAEEGKEIPATKPMSEWQANRDYRGWTWGVIDVPIERSFGPAEKINITVPGRLLKQIDEHVKKLGQTRCGFLTQAALDAMRRERV